MHKSVLPGGVLVLAAILWGLHAMADAALAAPPTTPALLSVAEQQPTPIPTIPPRVVPPFSTIPPLQATPTPPRPTVAIPVSTATPIRPPATAQPVAPSAPAQVPARAAPTVAAPAPSTASAQTAPRAGSMPLELAQAVFVGSALALGGGLFMMRRRRSP
jgi:hypothetical protein